MFGPQVLWLAAHKKSQLIEIYTGKEIYMNFVEQDIHVCSCLADLHRTGWNLCLALHPCKSCAFGHLNAKPYFSLSYAQIFHLTRSAFLCRPLRCVIDNRGHQFLGNVPTTFSTISSGKIENSKSSLARCVYLCLDWGATDLCLDCATKREQCREGLWYLRSRETLGPDHFCLR